MNLSFHCNDWELTFRDLQFITISQIIIYCGWNMILLLLCLSLPWGQIENFMPSFPPPRLVLQPCFEKPPFFCIYYIWWNDTILNLQASMSVCESSTSSSREWKETSLMSTQGLQWTKFANSEHRTEQETFLWSTFFGGWGGVGDMPCSTWDFSSPTRDQTHTPLHWMLCRGNFHWTAKEVPHMEHLNYVFAVRQEASFSASSPCQHNSWKPLWVISRIGAAAAVRPLSCVWLFVTPRTTACQAPCPWDFPGKNTIVGCHCLFSFLSFWRGSSRPRDRTHVSRTGRRILYHWATMWM